MASVADEERLLELMERLKEQWRRASAPIADLLEDGVQPSALEREATGLPFRLPSELRTWWGWHNGIRGGVHRRRGADDFGSIGPGSYLMLSLHEAIEEYHGNRNLHTQQEAELSGVPDMFWHEGWMPFMTQQAQRLYMDCADVAPGRLTPVRLVSHEWEDFEAECASSLTDAVELWVQAFEAGLYRWSQSDDAWKCEFAELPFEWRGTGLF